MQGGKGLTGSDVHASSMTSPPHCNEGAPDNRTASYQFPTEMIPQPFISH